MKRVALITGASSGIGEALALEVDRATHLKIDEIWLVARRTERLENLAQQLQHTKGVPISCDLTRIGERDALFQRLQETPCEVALLINNAGRGAFGAFLQQSRTDILQMLQLNIEALVDLTHEIGKHMQKGSSIVQIASGLAYIPAPYSAVYAATKAFVLHLSEALFVENRKQGIQVLTICPGPVATEFYQAAHIHKMVLSGPFLAKSDQVAREILSHVGTSTRTWVPTLLMRILVNLSKCVPKRLLLTGTAQTLRNWGKSEKIRS